MFLKEKRGLSDITAQMLNEGTKLNSSEALQQKLDQLGSSIRFSSGGYQSNLVITSLTKNLEKTLFIADEMLFQPVFNASDFVTYKKSKYSKLGVFTSTAFLARFSSYETSAL